MFIFLLRLFFPIATTFSPRSSATGASIMITDWSLQLVSLVDLVFRDNEAVISNDVFFSLDFVIKDTVLSLGLECIKAWRPWSSPGALRVRRLEQF